MIIKYKLIIKIINFLYLERVWCDFTVNIWALRAKPFFADPHPSPAGRVTLYVCAKDDGEAAAQKRQKADPSLLCIHVADQWTHSSSTCQY